jgi:hypothetical protein
MPIPSEHTLKIDEGERQMLLLAMAELALSRPGFDQMLSRIAKRIDNAEPTGHRPQLYSELKRVNADRVQAERGPMMPLIAQHDEENIQRWLYGVENEAPQPSGDFLKKIVAAALHADCENYPLLRPAIIALKKKFPKYRLDDPHLEPALHRDRHQLLHGHLDELIGDYLGHNRGAMPSTTTLMQLIEWSHKQTIEPER